MYNMNEFENRRIMVVVTGSDFYTINCCFAVTNTAQ